MMGRHVDRPEAGPEQTDGRCAHSASGYPLALTKAPPSWGSWAPRAAPVWQCWVAPKLNTTSLSPESGGGKDIAFLPASSESPREEQSRPSALVGEKVPRRPQLHAWDGGRRSWRWWGPCSGHPHAWWSLPRACGPLSDSPSDRRWGSRRKAGLMAEGRIQ